MRVHAKPPHEGHARLALQDAVEFAFVEELGVFGSDALQLDCHVFSGSHVGAEVDLLTQRRR